MGYVLVFVLGVVSTSVAWYFIARNNKKHLEEILTFDAKKAKEEIKKLL